MASNSDMFDYLLPTKRRKYSVSSEILNKCGEKLDSMLYSDESDKKIIIPEDKNNKKIEDDYEYEEFKSKHKIPESHAQIPSKPSSSVVQTTQTDMSIYFEECVNDLMSKNGFLLPINHNHQQEDYYDDDEDDEDVDNDEGDLDDDYDYEKNEIYEQIAQAQNKSQANEIFKAKAKNIRWVRKQILAGVHPLEIRSLHLPHINDVLLWSIITRALSDPPRRMPLGHLTRIEDVVNLLKTSRNIIVLTGAGVSVSCGIPDFRSRDGIYSRLAIDYPDLPDPQAMFSISYFNQDPRPFFKFAREIYPGQFKPSPCHRFIKLLEHKNKLLRNYTQNIDTLEQISGIKNVIECHGSFATATCTRCRNKVSASDIRNEIFEQKIPLCPICNPNQISPSSSDLNLDDSYKSIVWRGIMKPDIVFFGEDLPEQFHTAIDSDRKKCDLLIVIGSSLKVRPVALIPNSIPNRVPQILINRESLSHLDFDIELLGNSDTVINQLCHMIGDDWAEMCWGPKLNEYEKVRKSTQNASPSLSPNPESNINSDSNDDDYGSVMQMSIDSGFDSSSNPSSSSSSNSVSSSSQISDSDYQTTLTSEESLLPSDRLPEASTIVIFDHKTNKPTEVTDEQIKEPIICSSSSYTETTKNPLNNNIIKKSIADCLPPNTYCRSRAHCYIFPGAEVYWDSEDDNDDTENNRFNTYSHQDDNSNFINSNNNGENDVHIENRYKISNFILNSEFSCNKQEFISDKD